MHGHEVGFHRLDEDLIQEGIEVLVVSGIGSILFACLIIFDQFDIGFAVMCFINGRLLFGTAAQD